VGLDLPYAGARSAFEHSGTAKRMVLEFKSGGQPVLAPLMARLAAPAFRELVSAARAGAGDARPGGAAPGVAALCAGDAPEGRPAGASGQVVVTWVPSHRAAQRERGYNQAELLARALAEGRPALFAAGLTRKPVRTKHQKELGRAGRQSNLRGAFVLDEKGLKSLPLAPTALVLVDDVHTTGATACELSSVLREGTGLPVHVFTFSRAVSSGREGHD
jgi:predicted amidophosphoribosyltransferase